MLVTEQNNPNQPLGTDNTVPASKTIREIRSCKKKKQHRSQNHSFVHLDINQTEICPDGF